MNLTLVEALKLASDTMLQGVLETVIHDSATLQVEIKPIEKDRCGCEDS